MFRPPSGDRERLAGEALVRLAGLDGDHASTRNDEGFSKYDGPFGHSLAKQYSHHGRMTDKQWAAAVRLAVKYRRQVGELPA